MKNSGIPQNPENVKLTAQVVNEKDFTGIALASLAIDNF